MGTFERMLKDFYVGIRGKNYFWQLDRAEKNCTLGWGLYHLLYFLQIKWLNNNILKSTIFCR